MTILGRDQQGKLVSISMRDRLTSMYVLGKTGMGKSTLIENMLSQDIAEGMGACLIEPHRDLTEHIIRRADLDRIDKEDIILLDPLDEEAFGLNIYDCPDITDPVMVGRTLNSVMDTFEKLYDMSRSTPQMAMVMRNLTLLLIHNPGMTLLEIPLILTDKQFRARLVANVPFRYQSFWKRFDAMSPHDQEELTRSSTNKVDEFINDPIGYYIFGQSHTSINFRSILDSGKVVLIPLSTDFPLLTSLLGSILISQLLMASLSRKDIPENQRRFFNLYIDEFQNFATPSMNKLLTESRKYHLSSVVSHQTRNQLPESIQSTTLNTGSLVCFRLTSEDAEELASEFNLDPPRLPPTIPRNVLDYINRHPSDVVKDFAGTYILQLQSAMKKKKERITDPEWGTTEYNPRHNFGAGNIEFDPEIIQGILNNIETLFYETLRQETIPGKELRRVIADMAPLLRYNAAFAFYDQMDIAKLEEDMKTTYERVEKTIRAEADVILAEKEPKVAELVEKLNLNDYDLAWLVIGHVGEKTKEELWQRLVEEAEEKRKYFPPTLEEMIEVFEDTMLSSLRYHRGFIPKDELYSYIATHDIGSDYSRKTKEEIRAMLADTAQRNKETLENIYAPEAVVRKKRKLIEKELTKLQSEVDKIKTDRDKRLKELYQQYHIPLELVIAKDKHFKDTLVQVLNILKSPEGKIDANPTVIATQQSYADRANQVANELTQMTKFHARIKIPDEEYLISTIPPSDADQMREAGQTRDEEKVQQRKMGSTQKKQRIIEYTRKNYCKSRAEVEAEIRRRQGEGVPTLPITRKHPV